MIAAKERKERRDTNFLLCTAIHSNLCVPGRILELAPNRCPTRHPAGEGRGMVGKGMEMNGERWSSFHCHSFPCLPQRVSVAAQPLCVLCVLSRPILRQGFPPQ